MINNEIFIMKLSKVDMGDGFVPRMTLLSNILPSSFAGRNDEVPESKAGENIKRSEVISIHFISTSDNFNIKSAEICEASGKTILNRKIVNSLNKME